MVIVGSHRWHPGVIGIAAGRLKDRLMKPTIVLGGVSEHEPAKGSGRSTPGVNLGAAVAAAKAAGLLINGGGHAAAAGLTVEWDKVEALKDFLSEQLEAEIAAAAGEARALSIDAVGARWRGRSRSDRRARPHRPLRPGPSRTGVRARRRARRFRKLVKEEHVRFTLEDARGARIGGIAFRAMKSALGEALMKREGVFHAAVRVKRNDWNGTVARRSRDRGPRAGLAQGRLSRSAASGDPGHTSPACQPGRAPLYGRVPATTGSAGPSSIG